MEIYLIRHTEPHIEKGICYGQSDLEVADTFFAEVENIRQRLPSGIEEVYSSPSKRCRVLAAELFPSHTIQYDDRLKELNFGEWEMQCWNEIDKVELSEWMADFVTVAPPGGESYAQLYERVTDFFYSLMEVKKLAIVSHGGVIRSILSHIKNLPLQKSFEVFSIGYGCVIGLFFRDSNYTYQIF